MDMADGNSAALRQHETQQERLGARHEAYGARVITDIIDDLFMGKKVAGLTLGDFMESVFEWKDHEALLTVVSRDDLIATIDSQKSRLESHIRDWCDGAGADYVAELEREMQADAEADAAEARAERMEA